jgi:uncharacterized protein
MFVALLLSVCSAAPHPIRDYDQCGMPQPSHLCDPDRILNDRVALATDLHRIDRLKSDCAYFEMGVFVTKSLQGQDIGRVARTVHDAWGVGDKICSTGILLVLAVDDRRVYISTGAGVRPFLSDQKCSQIIDEMKPLLRGEDYDGAVRLALTRVESTLEDNSLLWLVVALVAVCGTVCVGVWACRKCDAEQPRKRSRSVRGASDGRCSSDTTLATAVAYGAYSSGGGCSSDGGYSLDFGGGCSYEGGGSGGSW